MLLPASQSSLISEQPLCPPDPWAQYVKFGFSAITVVVVDGITSSAPINITAVVRKNIANAVLFTLVFGMEVNEIASFYAFV